MSKGYKVKRYGYEWGGHRKQWWKKALSTVLLLCVAGGIGWLAYEPVYKLVMNMGSVAPPVTSAPAPATQPESASPDSVPAPPATEPAEQEGLPEQLYYLPDTIIGNKPMLTQALTALKGKGATGILFDLKDAQGRVLYDSKLPITTENLALSATPYRLAEVLETITRAGLTPVGRLFAFQDSTSTASMSEGAVKYMDSKVNWLDKAKADGGKAWLNPNSALARDYLLQLVEEVSAMGVKQLVLDGVQFPTGFSLQLATYGGKPDKSAVLAEFLQSAAQRVQKHEGQVYPVVRLDAAAGVNALPYGEAPEKLIAAAGGGILDIRPEQFGLGVATQSLTLAKPLLTPYDTVKLALDVATPTLSVEGAEFSVLVQAYTSTTVDAAANKPYTATEVAEQVKGAVGAGISKVLYYNPTGQYD